MNAIGSEAWTAAAHGLSMQQALRTITIDAAQILGVDKRVESPQVGKDGDVALFDGDPFGNTSYCIGVVVDSNLVSDEER